MRAITSPRIDELLTPALLTFLAELERRFGPQRRRLLRERKRFRQRLASGELPAFREETRPLRERDWQVAAAPADLQDRRVEITGPTDRKMVINALNSGASVYMADFEDAHSPTWAGTLRGQQNLQDAVRRRIEYVSPEGRRYRLTNHTATLMVRPRGLHLEERHVLVDDRPISASWFDFGVFAFHNARELVRRGSGPYFYLPKLEHYPEARLWDEVLRYTEESLGLARGTLRACVLIETLPAAFEMEEILYELRERSLGLNCGRWDYIFSFVKQLRDDPRFVLPERGQLTMDRPFLTAYATLLVQTCHRRGAHAIGGMAAQIPIRDDAEANARALAKVVADKEREVKLGHDGTWVAHPALVPVAREVFDRAMPTPNQIGQPVEPVPVTPRDLLRVPEGTITRAGLRANVRAPLRYLEAWLRGYGSVAIDHLMEDAATVEISRAQLWQWIRQGAALDDGTPVGAEAFHRVLSDERGELLQEAVGDEARIRAIHAAERLLDRAVLGPTFPEFVTLPAYAMLE